MTSVKEIAPEPHARSTLKAGNELLLLVSRSWKELKGEQGTADDPDNAF